MIKQNEMSRHVLCITYIKRRKRLAIFFYLQQYRGLDLLNQSYCLSSKECETIAHVFHLQIRTVATRTSIDFARCSLFFWIKDSKKIFCAGGNPS